MSRARIGVWFVGAKGGVASTAILGMLAVRDGAVTSAGLVSELPQFAAAGLAPWSDFVIAGHEIREVSLVDSIERMCQDNRAIQPALLERYRDELAEIDQRILRGTILNAGETISGLAGDQVRRLRETPRAAIERLKLDFDEFMRSEKLAHLIVVNVASTEPSPPPEQFPACWADLEEQLDDVRKCPLPASTIYAIAALDSGHSFLNFTPSVGSNLPAVDELARMRGARHMGRDGKTGETLLKSVLAPMFAARNLQVMSWVGHNIFGNMDAKVLDDPVNKRSKVTSKDQLLGEILGYPPQTLVTIENIASMGDWKTAWDHIHFQGFLGTQMTFQFIWQGCDSILAAPLVLDLIRFTERSWRAAEVGELKFLSSFFKSPQGADTHDFFRQFRWLEEWAAGLTE